MGLASRRRYRWTRGRISDYWDEVFISDWLVGHAALDDQSAFIANLGSSRSARMRDVLGTIQADQDAIIRAGSRGALVVDGGPGTGKTVVALHRSAYLLYSDPRLGHRRGSVLFVGPHQPYLAYVADVLPSLGEEGVQTCTLRDLVAEGAAAAIETDPDVARLKSPADLVKAIEPAVRFYENPPTKGMTVETHWSDIWLSAADWAEAFEAPERAWPLIEPADLVADLWSVPAYLQLCAPWLSPDDVQQLQREDAQAWTVSDLPLLDAARLRLGDPEASRRKRRHDAAVGAEREQMARVVDELHARNRGFTAAFMSAFPNAMDFAAGREYALSSIAELARRAKDAGHLRPEFVLDDVILIFMANRGIRATAPAAAVAASRRFAALAIQALQASPGVSARSGDNQRMDYEVTVRDVEARRTAVVAEATTWQDFPRLWGELLGEVWDCLRAGGIYRECRNIMLYLDGAPNVEVGVLLDQPCPLTGRVVASALPSGTAAMTVHRGPFGDVGAAHDAVLGWCAAHGHGLTGPRWEVYGPHNDDPARQWTEVYWLLS